jgi:hypothetical protein
MKLKDLEGRHFLSGVDFESQSIHGDCSVVRFRLDGIVYCARENAEDYYRSLMGELEIVKDDMTNVFGPVEVIAEHAPGYVWSDGTGTDDILWIKNAKTNKPILVVGTEEYNNYYPYFVARFSPENIEITQI